LADIFGGHEHRSRNRTIVFGVVLGVVGAIINSLPSGPDPGYRGENPEEAGRGLTYL
jgi:hypothetical protein